MPKAKIAVSPDALGARPKLAAIVMQVIGEWAHIDGNLALILSNLLKSDFMVASEMYQALTGGEARKSALLAAARTALGPDDFLLFQAILRETKASRDQRNTFAHYVWAWSDELPEALLLVNPAVVVRHEVQWKAFVAAQKVPRRDGEGYILPFVPKTAAEYEHIQVYRERDLNEALALAQQAQLLVTQLWHVTGQTPYSVQTRKLLGADPRIQHWIQKWSSGNGP